MSWTHAWLSELFWKEWLHSLTEDKNLGDGYAFRLGAEKSLSGTEDVAKGDESASAVFQYRPQQLASDSICVSWLGRKSSWWVTLWCSSYHTLSGYRGEEETCKSEHPSPHQALRLWYAETQRVKVTWLTLHTCMFCTYSFPVVIMAGT